MGFQGVLNSTLEVIELGVFHLHKTWDLYSTFLLSFLLYDSIAFQKSNLQFSSKVIRNVILFCILPPVVITVLYVTVSGNLLEWYMPRELALDGIEFRALISGAHTVTSDFMYACLQFLILFLMFCLKVYYFYSLPQFFFNKYDVPIFLYSYALIC